jgi:hypothetical protein
MDILGDARFKRTTLSPEEEALRLDIPVTKVDSSNLVAPPRGLRTGYTDQMREGVAEALRVSHGIPEKILYEGGKQVCEGDLVEIPKEALFRVVSNNGVEVVLENVVMGRIKAGAEFFSNCRRFRQQKG